jgi:hypothetical protein
MSGLRVVLLSSVVFATDVVAHRIVNDQLGRYALWRLMYPFGSFILDRSHLVSDDFGYPKLLEQAADIAIVMLVYHWCDGKAANLQCIM